MFGRNRSGARRLRRARSNRSTSSQRTHRRKPLFELLEDRRMLTTLTVNSALDNVTPGDGFVTLREAIIAANTDTATDLGQTGSGPDTIQFAPSLSGATIQLGSTGELKITSALSIDALSLAGGLTIKAFDTTAGSGDGTRIFNIDDGNAAAINVQLNGLTLTGGDVAGPGGAILSKENLTMVRSTVTGNRATLDGGGINHDTGALYLSNSTVSGNKATRDGGGVYQKGGSLLIIDSTISGNQGRLGGGVNMTAVNSTSAMISGSTFSGNTADTGGGLLISDSTTTIVNTTVSGNSAANLGGGIWANITPTHALKIAYSTITRNIANSDATGGGSGGGIYFGPATGPVTLKNTIIAGNSDFSNIAPDIDDSSAATHPTITQMFNLVGNNKGAVTAFPAGALIGTATSPINPLLAPLTNNGGPTKTHALLGGSPAIDAGDPAFVPGGANPTNDQRGSGFPRVTNGRLDIGAFELTPPLTQSTMALLASSDTGMFNSDRVTNKMQPAFGGVGPAGSTVLVYAQATDSTGAPSGAPFVIGTGTVGSDPTAGSSSDGFGAWEVTVEPMADGKWLFFSRFDTIVVPIEGPIFHVLSDPVGSAPQTLTPIDTPKPIPDGPDGVVISQIFTGGGGGGAGASVETKFAAKITVTVNITHTFDGDLSIFLIGPDGTSVLLVNRRGGGGDNFTNTVFDDDATTSITAGAPPFTGSFRPEQPLSALTGLPVNGPWTLQVIDNDAGVTGTLVSWSLAIEPEIGVVIDTVAPNTPFLKLISDSGRNNADNVTKFNTPSVSMTSTDPNGQFAQLLFSDNLKFRIYDRFVSPGGNAGPEVLIYDSAQDPDADAISNANDMFTSATQLTKIMPFLKPSSPGITVDGKLADGTHNFKLVVEDRAGNISHDFQQTITVDTVQPPISFGLPDTGPLGNATDGLTAASDSGVTTVPATYADRITNVTTPTFWGRAEANSIVRLYYDKNADGKIQLDGANADIFLGQTTAIPLDGNDAYPNGYWEIRSALDLNQIVGVPKDGLRRLLATAEDVAGNPTQTPTPGNNDFHELTNVASLKIFIDTQGPQVTAVTPNNSNFNLFSLKPAQTGPTPLVNSLTIAFKDLPSRLADAFQYDALVSGIASTPGNYVLVGDHVGTIAIASIPTPVLTQNSIVNQVITAVTSTSVFKAAGLVGAAVQPEVGDYVLITTGAALQQVRRITAYDSATGQITLDVPLLNLPAPNDLFNVYKVATAKVTLNFAAPLPDDRYTLTIKDNLVDPAGNKLDGESHQNEPQPPLFPSGDGVPGGNFVARFTIDSRPEIGNYVSQNINIDINGNNVWDPANSQIGNDTTNIDLSFTLQVQTAAGATAPGGFNVHDLLFAGKFTKATATSPALLFDQLAAFGNSAEAGPLNGFRWIIDTNGDGVITLGTDIANPQPTLANFNIAGAIPVAGNFDNNANNGDEIGLYNAGKWYLDTNHNFVIGAGDTLINSTLFGAPIVGDFDGDGKTDLAVFNNNAFSFDLAFNGFGTTDATITWGFPGVLDKPVAADMDQDGITDIGLWVPRTDATNPFGVAQWYFLVSNDFATPGVPAAHTAGSIAKINHAFSPTPLGHDIFAEFGDERSLPIVGNFDPPVSAAAVASIGKAMGDYDGNGIVNQADSSVWKASYGSTTNLAADGNGNGVIDAGDYAIWRHHMGQTVPGAGSGAASLTAEAAEVSFDSSASQVAPLLASAPSAATVADAPAVRAPSLSPTATPASSSVASTAADRMDQALLLLLNEPQPAGVASSDPSSMANPNREPTADEDDAATDSEALAIAWQSWSGL